jgi:hypothetical protein
MNDQPLPASTNDEFQAYRRELARATSLRRSQPEARDDTGRIPAAHPLKRDERGFPAAHPARGGLSKRLMRLLVDAPHYDSFNRRTEKP